VAEAFVDEGEDVDHSDILVSRTTSCQVIV
jgi:hypothetical protein